MNLLQPDQITSAHLKMGILGFQGGGKTKTAGKTAIGLYKYMQSKGIDCANKPVAFFDTETGSDWLIPDFAQAGVPLVVAKRRSFADLLAVLKEAEAGASVLIIDSITHPWRELCESYMRKKQRTFLQMDDWGYLKGEHGWAKFTDLFVNSRLHIIMCGRAGYEFEDYKDDNGKRQIEKVGTKMKTEGETGFEPSLLVLMEQVEDLRTGKVKHRATVQKDRSTLLDGEQIDNPDFKDFLPHIERLNLGGDHIGVDINGDSQHILKTEKRDWQPVQRKIALGEIEEILVRHYPGQAAADKKAKVELLRAHFRRAGQRSSRSCHWSGYGRGMTRFITRWKTSGPSTIRHPPRPSTTNCRTIARRRRPSTRLNATVCRRSSTGGPTAAPTMPPRRRLSTWWGAD